MIIRIEYSGDIKDAGDEYEASCDVIMDGKKIASGANFSECPEDANLGRDLSFVYKLADALKLAYEAGVKGEGFEIQEIPFA